MDNKKNGENGNRESDKQELNNYTYANQEDIDSESLELELEDNSNNKQDDDISSFLSNDDRHNIPNSDVEMEGNMCNICYIEKEDLNILECCKNTKKICNECLDCLTRPICPYCRQSLPTNLTKNIEPSSCPNYTMSNWMSNESRYLLIDPNSQEYSDSRILRRQIRRMRRNYYRTLHGGGLYSKREKINYRRSKRRSLRNRTRQITNQINNSNNTEDILDDLSFEDLF